MSKTFLNQEVTERFSPEQIQNRKWAYSNGGPLHIPAHAPKTLTEAILRTAREYPTHGVRYVQADGSEDFQPYPQLLGEARQVLSGLRAKGLKPGDRVILQCERLRDHFTAFWACVLCGVTPVTVAIAPSYEEKNGVVNKLYNIWKLLEEPPIITNAHLESALSRLPQVAGMTSLRLLKVEELRQNEPAEEIYDAKPSDLVFFQLTSGSTGVPKCIQEIHSAIIAHIHGSQQFCGYSPDDMVMSWLPVDHVVPILTMHLKDVYLGCNEIQCKSDYILADARRWLDLMDNYRVTHTWSPNFAFKLVADRLKQDGGRGWDLSCVKFLMNAGEQVTLPVVTDFLKETAKFGIREEAMQPAFGMAEVCTCMTYTNDYSPKTAALRFKKATLTGLLEPAPENDPASVTFIDLGPPVPGIEIRITDNENKLVPEGVIGRFQIRGASVTPGYLKNPEANAAAFVGDGWFNTGDIGFILNGRLTLTGREKEMIIVRGANFYCYEIEDVVNSVEGVEPTFTASCAVSDASTGSEGLAIFFVPKAHPADMTIANDDPAWPQVVQLVRSIKTKVAANLGISPLVVLPLTKKTFPKTTSGKIQRTHLKKGFEAGEFAALQQALAAKTGVTKKAAGDERERKLLLAWQNVLGTAELGVEDNFFEIGGDSLRAMQILARVRESFGVELPLSSLFGPGATIAGMSRLIETEAKKGSRSNGIPKAPAGATIPLTAAQERIWLLEQMESGPAVYNVGLLLRITGDVNVAAVRKSLELLTTRHAVLRTSYHWTGKAVEQLVAEQIELPFSVEEAHGASEAAMITKARVEALERFDLAQAPLWRAKLHRVDARSCYLAFTFHQTITDVWSLQNFVRELGQAYEAATAGRAPEFAPLPIQFSDFAFWLRLQASGAHAAEGLQYWKTQLANPPRIFEALAPDNTRQSKATHTAALIAEPVEKEIAAKVRAVARKNGATYFMAVLAAYEAFLHKKTGVRDVLLGSALAGRSRVETEKLLGFLVNTVVFRSKAAEGTTYNDLIAQAREQALGAHANQEVPFEKLLDELKPERQPNRPPLFQAWLSAWEPLPEVEAGNLRIEAAHLWTSGAQHDISVFVKDCEQNPTLFWEYNPDLYNESTIRAFISEFNTHLRKLCDNPEAPLDLPKAAASSTPEASSIGQFRRKRVAVAA
ncbi:MAG TPA: condensation domain-containing protein [Methylomirabilota bacterium]|nr:condensation domain-containing protein [Methylomirabilota bacterium]